MASFSDLMQMCRLCLVKDQVNLPIFGGQGDVQQIFLKITACLPVKVSREDNLPKSICDGCSYKLDLLYQFWNTSSNSEKQLIDWLTAAGVDPKHKSLEPHIAIGASQSNVILKQEPVTELDASLSSDSHNYILQQQQLAYKPEEYEGYQKDAQTPAAKGIKTKAVDVVDETAAKRPRRVTRNTKPVKEVEEDDSEDDDDDFGDNADTGMTKTEDDSEEDDDDDGDADGDGDGDGDADGDGDDGDMPDADFGTAEEDADQPGPSGVSAKTSTGPYDIEVGETSAFEEIFIETIPDKNYQCEVCAFAFPDRKSYLEHHMAQFGSTFSCCRCGSVFRNTTELYHHYETHKLEPDPEYIVTEEHIVDEIIENVDSEYDEQMEAVINIPDPDQDDPSNRKGLVYILEDTNCENEVVVDSGEQIARKAKSDFSVVQVDHGYIIPACFRGQLDSKKRKKKDTTPTTSSTRYVDYDEQDQDSSLEQEVAMDEDEPSTSKDAYSSNLESMLRSRLPAVRRRHEIPDFTATNYEIINPTSEIDFVHYRCLRCEQLFINKFSFFRHIEKGKCYINSCDVCPSTFSKNTDFYHHYMSVHPERAVCNFCFRTFMYEKNVKEHMLRHLDQFRHRCEACNKGFYTVREYRNHYKNRHMGIRHKCTECGRTFADEYYFKKHIATHGLQIAEEPIE